MEIRSFENAFNEIARYQSPYEVFDDFLTICICCFSQEYGTGKSRYESGYMETIAKYDKEVVRKFFPKLMASMIKTMEDHKNDSQGNDVIGHFYETNIASKQKNGVFFTPFTLGKMIASIHGLEMETEAKNILDPACGSGRLLVAAGKESIVRHNLYGIDILPICVKNGSDQYFPQWTAGRGDLCQCLGH